MTGENGAFGATMKTSGGHVNHQQQSSNQREDKVKPEYLKGIKKHSKKMGLHYRGASEGMWVAFLLPIAIFISDLKFQSQSKSVVILITLHSLLLCIFYWMELNISLLLQRLRKVNMLCSVITFLVLLAQGATMYESASYVVINFTFPYMFYNIVKQHPRSFTFGEAVLVTSAFAYNFWAASQNVPFPPQPIQAQQEPILVSLFLQGVFFVSILLARFFLLLQKPWKLFILEETYCLWAKYCLIAFVTRLPIQDEDILWFLSMWPFKFLIASSLRVYLISFWAIISMLTGGFVISKHYLSNSSTSVDRKVFHIFIVAVFLPGIVKEHTLLFCCSAVLFFIFILIETIRVLNLEVLRIKIGETVDQSIRLFRDSQDEGRLILTPIYLLVGCSVPIWLTGLHHNNPNDLKPIEYSACLAGILSIGIGDTFASIGGIAWGRTYWKNSRKTVEGTICSIISQVIVATLIFISGVIPHDTVSVAAVMVGIVVNAVVEGKTDQIDNLVLPLVTFIVIHVFGHMFNKSTLNDNLAYLPINE